MGIVQRQTIKGSIYSYLGVIVGFVTTSYLFPRYLKPDIIGLFGLLIAYSTLLGQFALLGMQGVTSRLFPYFRDKKSGHHGFLIVAFIFIAIGFFLFLVLYFVFSPWLISNNLEKSKLFADYVYLLIPLTFFSMLFYFFDTYNKVLYDAVFGLFLQEFVQRVLILAITLGFIFHLLSLNQLIVWYVIVLCIKSVIIIVYLYQRGEISFQWDFRFITRSLKKEIIDVAFFSILSGMGSMIVFNIDKIIINQILDLSKTGVYTVAFYFGTLVVIPSRPLLKISGTLIADAWAKNDLSQIRDIYYKSCINQFIIGGFLFLGLWANIDNILNILGPDYQQSKWAIFFIGIAYLFDMLTGANTQVIAFSKHYRVSLYFIAILLVIVSGLLFLLIPVWGIVGAAAAIAGGMFLNNLMRYFFLYRKFGLQPFNRMFVFLFLFFTGLYFLLTLIPQLALIPDILLRGVLITIATGLFLYFVPVSDDVKNIFKRLTDKIEAK